MYRTERSQARRKRHILTSKHARPKIGRSILAHNGKHEPQADAWRDFSVSDQSFINGCKFSQIDRHGTNKPGGCALQAPLNGSPDDDPQVLGGPWAPIKRFRRRYLDSTWKGRPSPHS